MLKIKLLPPQLNETNIKKKILCARPLREGEPYITAEIRHAQLRIHNYGHGGSGWALLWGSVEVALDCLQEQLNRHTAFQNKNVVIIGAGAMGLVTALSLLEKKQQHKINIGNIEIVAEKIHDIASWNAGGLWAQVATSNDEQGQAFVNQLARQSFLTYLQIACDLYPQYPHDLVELQSYFTSNKMFAGVEGMIELGLLPPPVPVEIHFDTTQHHAQMYKTLYVNTHLFMQTFHKLLLQANVNIKQKIIHDFDEFDNDTIIINCAGVGAKDLNQDKQMRAVYGHIMTLQNQPKAFLLPQQQIHIDSKKIIAFLITLADEKTNEMQIQLLSLQHHQTNNQKADEINFIMIIANIFKLLATNYPEKLTDFVKIYQQLLITEYHRYMFLVCNHESEYTYFVVTTEDPVRQMLASSSANKSFSIGKIGGTFLSDEALANTSNEIEFAKILQRMQTFCYGKTQ